MERATAEQLGLKHVRALSLLHWREITLFDAHRAIPATKKVLGKAG